MRHSKKCQVEESRKKQEAHPGEIISIDILSPTLAQILKTQQNKDHVRHHKNSLLLEATRGWNKFETFIVVLSATNIYSLPPKSK